MQWSLGINAMVFRDKLSRMGLAQWFLFAMVAGGRWHLFPKLAIHDAVFVVYIISFRVWLLQRAWGLVGKSADLGGGVYRSLGMNILEGF